MEVQNINSLNYTTNVRQDVVHLVKHTVQDGWADWLRMLEPFDWFITLTLLTDIRTFNREFPDRYVERYQWVEHTNKYPNGTYVRTPGEIALVPLDTDWVSDISYNAVAQERFARSQYLIWIRRLNEAIYGRRFREQGLGVDNAYGMEFQKRGVIHLHAVLRGIPETVSMTEWAVKWYHQHPNIGYATIKPYDPALGAVGYLGKYIVKGGQVDLWLSKNTLARVRQIELKPQAQGLVENPSE